MKKFISTSFVLFLLGIFSQDFIRNEGGFGGYKHDIQTLYDAKESNFFIPTVKCTSESKTTNKCRTFTIPKSNGDNLSEEFKDLRTIEARRANCKEIWTNSDMSREEYLEAEQMCSRIEVDCKGDCENQIHELEILTKSFEYTGWCSGSRNCFQNTNGAMFNERILFAKSSWDPLNNRDDSIRLGKVMSESPFFDRWIYAANNSFYMAEKFNMLFLLNMAIFGLAIFGAVFLLQISIRALLAFGSRKDKRFKTGYKDNKTPDQAVASVQGPLSKLDPIRDMTLRIGSLCYLPFFVYIILFLPGGIFNNIISLFIFYLAAIFVGGLFVLIYPLGSLLNYAFNNFF
tara:strand:- start:2217 stop:3248 length:1032 start_codon:yes stop_codon:yes gene_type:complete